MADYWSGRPLSRILLRSLEPMIDKFAVKGYQQGNVQLKAIAARIGQVEFTGLPVLVFDAGEVFLTGGRLASPTPNALLLTE